MDTYALTGQTFAEDEFAIRLPFNLIGRRMLFGGPLQRNGQSVPGVIFMREDIVIADDNVSIREKPPLAGRFGITPNVGRGPVKGIRHRTKRTR